MTTIFDNLADRQLAVYTSPSRQYLSHSERCFKDYLDELEAHYFGTEMMDELIFADRGCDEDEAKMFFRPRNWGPYGPRFTLRRTIEGYWYINHTFSREREIPLETHKWNVAPSPVLALFADARLKMRAANL